LVSNFFEDFEFSKLSKVTAFSKNTCEMPLVLEFVNYQIIITNESMRQS